MHFHRHRFSLVRPASALIALLAGLTVNPHQTDAHGFAGQRFFPATLTTDDPFVADEMSLPTLQTFHTPEGGGTREFDVSVELAKRITPYLDIEIGIDQVNLFPHAGRNRSGLQQPGTRLQIPVLHKRAARAHRLARPEC